MDIVKLTRRHALILFAAEVGSSLIPAISAESPGESAQPYFASVARALGALDKLGAPLPGPDAARVAALALKNDSAAVVATEKILTNYTLIDVTVDEAGAAKLSAGNAQRILIEQGWRLFLLRVSNASARPGNLLLSPGSLDGTPGQMMPGDSHSAQRANLFDTLNKAPLIEKMWLLCELEGTTSIIAFDREVPVVSLSGVPIEYHVVKLFSRDRGQRRATLTVSTMSSPADGVSSVGNRELTFDCLPSRSVGLTVLDTDGRGCVAALMIKDQFDRVYPPQAMRIAPDLFFQPQIYRGDGETVRLPDGKYTIEARRGPEYLPVRQTVEINEMHSRVDVRLERWIDPSKWGLYSGDTHIHAGGCAHYQVPTEGVSPETMIRQVRGEGLSIGDVLTWGPSWYYQKQFFTGHANSPQAALEHPELQVANNVTLEPKGTTEDGDSAIRYDVEVSGFPSSHAGHLVLLRLRQQDYPGTKLIEDWPSWNLPILKWVKQQGAVGGYAHCGIGMQVDSTELPNFEIPPMDGIGTQEAIIDVTHGVVDFLSGCDTNPVAELNAWYHMLNCGFRLAMIGETDYPCITGDRLGVGRSYVWLERSPAGDEGYEAWIRGLAAGRLYCGDGRSHFLQFTVNDSRSGENDVRLKAPGTVAVDALVAARLEPQVTPETAPKRVLPGWGWHLEWARMGTTREVPVELVVNGASVERATLIADGKPRPIRFKRHIERSSWIALRILPSAHTHPIYVQVGEKPIRASRRSAQWCRACVDKVWAVKSPFMREVERPEAANAFDHARQVYDRVAAECETE